MTRALEMPHAAAAERLIVALDFTALGPSVRMARQLLGVVRIVKVGSVLFTACGPSVIQRLRTLGFSVMLDLKFFDIPSTVELSCRAAVRHGVTMMTIHAAGARAMLEAAVAGVRAEARRLGIARPLVLGVTVLTSVGEGSSSQLTQQTLTLAQAAARAGCDGIVASAQDAEALRRRFGTRLSIVCPGIRPSRTRRQDQRRVCTPAEALRRGADALIIGRPITEARRPRSAAQAILNEMEDVDGC